MVELRRRYPDWGWAASYAVLRKQGVDLAQTTIHRILLRHDLVSDGEDRHTLAFERFERGAPNELWQMDFKGGKAVASWESVRSRCWMITAATLSCCKLSAST